MVNQREISVLDEKIASLNGLEVLPNYRLKNTLTADLECLLNIRGLSGNAGSFPFLDCICTQKNRNLPKSQRKPCEQRTIKSCQENHQKWMEETHGDKKKVSRYQNCLNQPLLTKAFADADFRLPLMHITCGIAVHDLGKLENLLFGFDQTAAVWHLDSAQRAGAFWDYIQFMKYDQKLSELKEKLNTTRSKQGKKFLNEEIQQLITEVKSVFGSEQPKLTKKTSLMMKLFNLALKKNGVKREKYWSGSLTGNNVYKFIHRIDPIFARFSALIDSQYTITELCKNPDRSHRCSDAFESSQTTHQCALTALKQQLEKYVVLFQKYLKAYKAVNHSNAVSASECDAAQQAIDEYMEYVHSAFDWKTTCNKAHYLQVFYSNMWSITYVCL